jgi:hypothetical protein
LWQSLRVKIWNLNRLEMGRVVGLDASRFLPKDGRRTDKLCRNMGVLQRGDVEFVETMADEPH